MSVDVAIVGAGAAGIAAARALTSKGASVQIIEAMTRIGGRTHTDTTTFGMAWDRGAHWLHSADVNPLTEIADRFGMEYVKRTRSFDGRIHLGKRWAVALEREDFSRWFDKSYATALAMGKRGMDTSASRSLDPNSRWLRMGWDIHEVISAMSPDRISTLDLFRYRDTGQNWPLEQGYGALIARYAEGLPVTLNLPVKHIEIRPDDVRLGTSSGIIEAKACIVTASTNVLASGRIRFTPALPDVLQRAFEHVPTGLANKIALQFSREVFGEADTRYESFMDERDPKRHALSFQLSPFGQNLAVGYIGGEFAKKMEAEGAEAMIDLARVTLVDMFGSDILKHLVKSAVTLWGAEPYIQGAYSSALPGHANDRALFARPLASRLFFAGEAVSMDWFSTVQGAHVSGIAAAEKAMAVLGR